MSTKKISFFNRSTLNIVFVFELAVIALVISGILPREVVLFLALLLAGYVLLAPLEDSTVFFVRSIPLFVALPITANFDQLNIWRILSSLIFLKWLADADVRTQILNNAKIFIRRPFDFIRRHNFLALLSLLLITAILSLIQAQSMALGIKRILYFINLSLAGIVICDLIRRNTDFSQRIIKNIAIPAIIVTIVGFIQLAMTYLLDIYQFMRIWGEGIDCRLFGEQWCHIAVNVGNTWFAYFGEQLSLRMFSLFPDSHSFPIFLLLGLPAIMALSLRGVVSRGDGNLRTMFKIRASMLVVFVPLVFLAAILSGTRGIWAAGGGMIALILFWLIYLRLKKPVLYNSGQMRVFKYVASYLAIFLLLFVIAYPIFASPQFLVGKSDSLLLHNRVRSIIDFGETSNSQRIEIWRQSISSIIKHPLAGVGIGNFPVVLGQDLRLARAGSSAHNIYLHIAAEMGIPALIFALGFIWLLLKKTFNNFRNSSRLGNSGLEIVYFASLLIFLPWVLLYSLTDVAVFDERAFLLLVATVAVVVGMDKTEK